jgi:hypothetical protein
MLGRPGAANMLEDLYKLQYLLEPEDEPVLWMRLAPPQPAMPDPLETSVGFKYASYEIGISLPHGLI